MMILYFLFLFFFFLQLKVLWQGMDGITGPLLSGTGFYMKREALYGNYKIKGIDHDGLVNFYNREVVCLDQHTSVVKCR